MRSVFWLWVGLAALLVLPCCRKDSGAEKPGGSSGASAGAAAGADVNQLTCKISGIDRTFSHNAKVLVDANDGVIITGFGDANEAELITIRVPKAGVGRFTLADTAKLSVHYSPNMYSSDSRDQYRGGSAEKGTVVEVRLTEVGGPGKPVKGTFSCLVKSRPEGVDLMITDGVISVIRGRPPKRPSIFRWGK
jgi:hypothetical protein